MLSSLHGLGTRKSGGRAGLIQLSFASGFCPSMGFCYYG